MEANRIFYRPHWTDGELTAFIKSLSDVELVKLQNEARQVNDRPLVNLALVELGERQKGKQDPHAILEYVRLGDFLGNDRTGIIIQFEDGGAYVSIPNDAGRKTVAARLRVLADLIYEEST